jgi:hypothetical protein
MPASALTSSLRYFRPDTSAVVFASAVANKNSPTRAEINAGTELAGEIVEISGFQTTSESLPTPDLASRFTSSIPGRITAEDSSITFYASSNSVDVRGLLPRDTAGFLLFMDEGDISGRKGDTFPVKVGSLAKDRSMEDPARIVISFTITSEPGENWTVPA